VHRNVSPETIPALNKRIAILGSTGSIGRSALAVLEHMPPGFEVVGLAAGSRWEALAEQVRRWRPRYAAISDGSCRDALMREVPPGTEVLAGPSGLEELVERCGCDWVLSSIVGLGGLAATVKAVELGKQVAVANKEALVVAGPLLTRLASCSGADIIPVDSEHSAVFQAIRCGSAEEVQRIFLTSSGGPFRTWPKEQIASASVEQALHHPVWDMGPKITIDSATMMNKALEVVEARWLFDVPAERIEVLIHPEAIVHALVEFRDGSIIAQLGAPDMRGPIQYALTYPQRWPAAGPRLSLRDLRQLRFEPPDPQRFPAVQLGFDVAARGGSAGAVLNAANEEAVEAFRARRIKLGAIAEVTADTLSRHSWIESPDWADLLAVDSWARNEVRQCLKC
jgi:1-deoxy-D-xylulose-5-phosphate reductoisomerase